METECKSKEGDGVTRHCAYCLQLCGSPAKLCSGCKKRAYCSKDCQVKDWSKKGKGQGHTNWCKHHECGEEDVDWEVVPVPDKGLGIKAKKVIPAGFKIIVEPVFNSPDGHPGIMDLKPEGGSLGEKFCKNLLNAENMFFHFNVKPTLKLALRIARVNHSCQPNAAAIYDETARVVILFAQKDIQPGEEISICYYSPFYRLDGNPRAPGTNVELCVDKIFQLMKNESLASDGVTCPADCYCFNPSIQALIREGKELYKSVTDLDNQSMTEEALEAGEKLLDIQRRLDVSWVYIADTYIKLFRVALKKEEVLAIAKHYLQSAVEIFRKICPYSESRTKQLEKALEHEVFSYSP